MKDYELGNKIYELRKKMNISQEQLGYLLGISDKSISKWENGTSRPSIANLRNLTEIFDISLDELMRVEKPKKNKKIVKIALTGGPCAGKTSALNWIQNNFEKQGYKILFVPEAATELITGGIVPTEIRNDVEFQSLIMDCQMQKEKIFEQAAKIHPKEKILIVCDRGTMDGKAYLSKKDFAYLLKKKGLSETKLRDSYDAVFHLVTAAKGAESYYNLDNPARTETIEEARKVDDALISSWTGHSHLRIIDNSTDFDNKMKKLIQEISNILGEPNPYEIERKFLIKMPDIKYLESLPSCEKVQIIQTYLKSNDNEEIRIRQRGANGSFTYSKTRKINQSSIKRIEIEERLTQEQYSNEMLNADPTMGQIIKDRYCLCYASQYFEIDIYSFWKDQAIAEIELSSEDQEIVIPPYLEVIREVTDEKEYKNASIAASIKKLVKDN